MTWSAPHAAPRAAGTPLASAVIPAGSSRRPGGPQRERTLELEQNRSLYAHRPSCELTATCTGYLTTNSCPGIGSGRHCALDDAETAPERGPGPADPAGPDGAGGLRRLEQDRHEDPRLGEAHLA